MPSRSPPSPERGACAERTRPALNLDGNRLTIYNDTDEEWQDVEVFLNHHFRIQPKNIEPAGGRAGAARHLRRRLRPAVQLQTMQITDLRLKAKRPNGEPIEVRYEFSKGGLEDALGGFKGKS